MKEVLIGIIIMILIIIIKKKKKKKNKKHLQSSGSSSNNSSDGVLRERLSELRSPSAVRLFLFLAERAVRLSNYVFTARRARWLTPPASPWKS